jgi:hypothetical protein
VSFGVEIVTMSFGVEIMLHCFFRCGDYVTLLSFGVEIM